MASIGEDCAIQAGPGGSAAGRGRSSRWVHASPTSALPAPIAVTPGSAIPVSPLHVGGARRSRPKTIPERRLRRPDGPPRTETAGECCNRQTSDGTAPSGPCRVWPWLPDQECAPGLHHLAPALQHVAAGIALLDLTADRVSEGLLRQLPGDPLVRTPRPKRAAEAVRAATDLESLQQPPEHGGPAAGRPSSPGALR